ncbi:amidohydrolase [Clostridium fermenticellae]|uniref:Amidohydrolase n=1 Tax=Clostridium fermenticellae TaxID=2068654 RepID=A0A386H1M0_9CLOT|nr:M20 family metallopeptidase [Clostridium fermenticellae]AYD39468.1 amidohydrolase [Clostridium fermenticellae]
MNLIEVIKENMSEIISVRKRLNDNAELSFKEYKTHNIINDFLNSMDIKTCDVFNTGVVGLLNRGDECTAIRADMDALPVNGVSHACGHDYHMAVVLGCALILKKIGFKKCIKFIFQPAEEDSGGALPMIREGVLKNPKVTKIVGFHVWPELNVGSIEVASGASMASVDDFIMTFRGKGGHAAMPYLCNNTIYPAMDFIQTSNEKFHLRNNPLNPFVATFASINSGNAPNVISDETKVMGTVRTFDNNLRKVLEDEIESTAKICAENFKCKLDIEYEYGYPPLINNAELTDKFIKLTKGILGSENVSGLEKSFTAEDFAFFAEECPSVHFRLGISDKIKGMNALHSSNFDASDEALFYGVYVIVNFILNM